MLCIFLRIGSPLEFKLVSHQRIAILLFAVFLIFFFILLIKSLINVANKIFKTIGLVVVSIIACMYLFLGIMHVSDGISWKSEKWKDYFLYTNDSGEKVYSQYSGHGSILNYREMKTYYEFENGNRISLALYSFETDRWKEEEDLRSNLPF